MYKIPLSFLNSAPLRRLFPTKGGNAEFWACTGFARNLHLAMAQVLSIRSHWQILHRRRNEVRCVEAQQCRAIPVAIVSPNYVVLVFYEVSHNYRDMFWKRLRGKNPEGKNF